MWSFIKGVLGATFVILLGLFSGFSWVFWFLVGMIVVWKVLEAKASSASAD